MRKPKAKKILHAQARERKRRRQRAHAVPPPTSHLLFKDDLLSLFGTGYSTIFEWMRDRDFPLAIELGPAGQRTAKIAWIAAEVHAWLAKRPRRKLGMHEFRGRLPALSENVASSPRHERAQPKKPARHERTTLDGTNKKSELFRKN